MSERPRSDATTKRLLLEKYYKIQASQPASQARRQQDGKQYYNILYLYTVVQTIILPLV